MRAEPSLENRQLTVSRTVSPELEFDPESGMDIESIVKRLDNRIETIERTYSVVATYAVNPDGAASPTSYAVTIRAFHQQGADQERLLDSLRYELGRVIYDA